MYLRDLRCISGVYSGVSPMYLRGILRCISGVSPVYLRDILRGISGVSPVYTPGYLRGILRGVPPGYTPEHLRGIFRQVSPGRISGVSSGCIFRIPPFDGLLWVHSYPGVYSGAYTPEYTPEYTLTGGSDTLADTPMASMARRTEARTHDGQAPWMGIPTPRRPWSADGPGALGAPVVTPIGDGPSMGVPGAPGVARVP